MVKALAPFILYPSTEKSSAMLRDFEPEEDFSASRGVSYKKIPVHTYQAYVLPIAFKGLAVQSPNETDFFKADNEIRTEKIIAPQNYGETAEFALT